MPNESRLTIAQYLVKNAENFDPQYLEDARAFFEKKNDAAMINFFETVMSSPSLGL